METATQFEQLTADNPNNPFIGDGRLFVRFSRLPCKDDDATKEAGRPIFKDVVYIEIHTPGDRDNKLHRPMTAMDKQRFAERYAKWEKSQTDEVLDGMPLSEWPAMPRSTLEEMRYFQVYTVEQLAELPDIHIKKFRELASWRKRAIEYLDVASRGAAASKLSAEKTALENRLLAQDQAIQEQAAIIRALQAKVGV
jgi:hypothetical protein